MASLCLICKPLYCISNNLVYPSPTSHLYWYW